MKKILISLWMLIAMQGYAQNEFYYYKDTKISLEANNQFAYLLCNINDKNILQEKLNGLATITKFHQDIYQNRLITSHKNSSSNMANPANYYAEIKFNNPNLTFAAAQKLIQQLKGMPEILHITNSYFNESKERVAITNYIWVGMKDENQISTLISEANKIDYAVVGQNPFMPEWVMLCPKNKTALSQIKAAQSLFETRLFNTAEPELIGEIKTSCVNDTHFPSQWGLSNTGQNGGTVGMDTRVCGAYTYTTGSNAVDIAIVDEGFENNHPDLDGNVQNTGYNTSTGATPSVVFGSHGTSCAGIAAAEGNNSLGVTGVAYNADLMSVAMDFNTATWAQISDGFNWARSTGGAEILSNSWVWNNPSGVFDAAVTNALTLGRGGLGCVVLFASANSNAASLTYPQNSNIGLINVGAMSPCGERKNPASCDGETWWGSNYGTGLDVMAPGVLMYTTDRQGNAGYNTAAGILGNYVSDFNGTSSACPHAAGVAALILSVNPCLTRLQVEQIMKRTSRKVGGYTYGTITADGNWNNQMGYGLLDAEAAVIMAGTTYLQNLTESTTVTHKGLFVEAGFNVNPFITNGNYVTTTNAVITINATYSIDMQPGCDLQGSVDATITPAGACATW